MLSNQWLNILIVGIYFVFLIVIGWIFRTFSSNTSDYFKGGGKMLWWMVGSTAFMTQFSAWSFTGAAYITNHLTSRHGFARRDG